MKRPALVAAFALGLALASGCAGREHARTGLGWSETLAPSACGDIANLHEMNGVLLASQPSEADFRLAAEHGVETVIDLRGEAEDRGLDEPALMAELGLKYENPGFSTPDGLTPAVFDAVRATLNDDSKKPVVLHCKSANRVGAVWLAHRVLDDGIEWEAALTEAVMVGLKSPALEERARAYVDSKSR